MNISIRCDDNMYKLGLIALLREIFSLELVRQTLSIHNFDSKNRATDDVMILMRRKRGCSARRYQQRVKKQ